MIKSLKLDRSSWAEISVDLKTKYPPSVFLSREKMKRILGFSDRRYYDQNTRRSLVLLDFFDEKKKIMFMLTYGDKISI